MMTMASLMLNIDDDDNQVEDDFQFLTPWICCETTWQWPGDTWTELWWLWWWWLQWWCWPGAWGSGGRMKDPFVWIRQVGGEASIITEDRNSRLIVWELWRRWDTEDENYDDRSADVSHHFAPVVPGGQLLIFLRWRDLEINSYDMACYSYLIKYWKGLLLPWIWETSSLRSWICFRFLRIG